MGNPATLQTAPPFTVDNASEMGRLGGLASAEARKLKPKKISAEQKHQQAQMQPDLRPEINRIARALPKLALSSPEHEKLSKRLRELWSLVWPTQAAVKSRSRPVQASVEPIAPQNNGDS